MKIDANVKIKRARCVFNGPSFRKDQVIKVPVDLDYAEDYDDVIKAVEVRLYEDYKIFLFNEIDFTIENAPEICSSL